MFYCFVDAKLQIKSGKTIAKVLKKNIDLLTLFVWKSPENFVTLYDTLNRTN